MRVGAWGEISGLCSVWVVPCRLWVQALMCTRKVLEMGDGLGVCNKKNILTFYRGHFFNTYLLTLFFSNII